MKKLYEHDCDKCNYIGSDNEFDVYYCANMLDSYTLILRYGNEGFEYNSYDFLNIKIFKTFYEDNKRKILKWYNKANDIIKMGKIKGIDTKDVKEIGSIYNSAKKIVLENNIKVANNECIKFELGHEEYRTYVRKIDDTHWEGYSINYNSEHEPIVINLDDWEEDTPYGVQEDQWFLGGEWKFECPRDIDKKELVALMFNEQEGL